MHKDNFSKEQAGFTMMEIIVSTAIFVTVVTGVLALFVYVMRINKEVQSVRQAAQGMRNFTEVLVREVRNGRISYSNIGDKCDPSIDYSSPANNKLALVTYTGDEICLYHDGVSNLQLFKNGRTETINPPNFKVKLETFRFIVRPTADPQLNKLGLQPMVTILADFVVNEGKPEEFTIPYQTTISSDNYDPAWITK